MIVLFLCTGNVHRSPLAEAMLRAALLRDGRSGIEVLSAGVAAPAGMPAAPPVAELARSDGLDLTAHRARQAGVSDLRRADLIVVMEAAHRDWVRARCPEAAPRCRLLGEFAEAGTDLEPGAAIPDADASDPGSFRRTYRLLRACVARLYRELPPAGPDDYARAVERRLGALAGSAVPISHADWVLLERWWDRGVPLWVVLETLDDLARRRRASGDPARPIRLLQCRRAVERRFGAHVGGLAPRPPGGPAADDALAAATERLASALRLARESGASSQAEALDRAAREVSSLEVARAGGEAPAAIRARLREVENSLLDALLELTPAPELEALRAEAAADLLTHRARMTPRAYESTLSRLIGERLRERHGLTRLVDD